MNYSNIFHHLKISVTLSLFILWIPYLSVSQPGTDEQLAAQYYNSGEFDKAVIYYENLFNQDRENPVYYKYYLNCLIKLKEFDKALKITGRIIKSDRSELSYLIDQGYIFQCSGNQKKADELYREVIRLIKADERQVQRVAGSFLGRDMTDLAIEAYLKGRKIFNGFNNFRTEIAGIYEKQKKYPEMVKEYIALANEHPEMIGKIEDLFQNAIAANHAHDIEGTIRRELLRNQQLTPDNPVYSEMLFWLFIQQKDFISAFQQAKAIDMRNKEDGSRMISLARTAASNKDFDAAIQCYQYIIKKGSDNHYYITARIELLNAEYDKLTSVPNSDFSGLLVLEQNYLDVIDEFGNSSVTAPLIRRLAHMRAFYLDKCEAAIRSLNELLSQSGINIENTALCKLELADIYLLTGEVWDATLIYSQVEKSFKNEPVGHEAKFRNAKLSYYIGEFDWAQAQLDVLKASTSKLIANDAMQLSLLISDNLAIDTSTIPLSIYSRADFLCFRNNDSLALVTIDTLLRLFPGHTLVDDALFLKYKLLIRRSQVVNAAKVLEEIVNTYYYDLLADDALFALAELTEKTLGNPEKAKELYEKILHDFPGSLYTVEARKRFRRLRGDSL
ncbi:MAG: tetratricopeptide repeat protein [Bacteroidetes bacterium]|nr:tetratricopeptide repeat protein [Bacteroidota bacterium]